MPYFRAFSAFWLRSPYLWIQSLSWWISIVTYFDIQVNPYWNRTLTYHFLNSKGVNHGWTLGELCGSVNPCQELICLAFYYQGLFLFSNQILVIWIPFLSRPDKTWKLADSLQLLTSGESSVVTDRYHLPATIPLQAGMINNIQLTRFLLLLYNVVVDLSMVFWPRQPI